MTRLKRLVLGGAAAALIMGGAATPSFAIENGDFTNNLSGASIGLPLGAAPPPGLYTGLESVYTPIIGDNGLAAGNQGGGAAGKVHVNGFIGIVPLVWATGWNFLGANLVLNVIQPFYEATVYGTAVPGSGTNFGPPYTGLITPNIANTVWGGALSWNLGAGWFFAAGFAFEGPDGSHFIGTPNPDYWSFEPTWAISYLANNWVLSANFAYFFNTASGGVCCVASALGAAGPGNGWVNGQELYVDLTALYKFGKWELGPVASIVTQTTNDRPGNGFTCAGLAGTPFACGLEQRVRVGGLVGYDFGPVDIQVWLTDDVVCKDATACGWDVWTRIGFRVWGPEAPHPLVAKN